MVEPDPKGIQCLQSLDCFNLKVKLVLKEYNFWIFAIILNTLIMYEIKKKRRDLYRSNPIQPVLTCIKY